ncbi:MAG: FCD domain-containing protein [Nitrospiraceae bacterium]|nr:FCD domain-containing protein [Nitrospiraceae bacterium]
MARRTLAEKAYEHLHARIAAGELASGAVVSEASLAKELGISRTPVGEAVQRLANEGLVEQVPRYGTIVCSLGRRDILEHYELREALESYAAMQAAERITEAQFPKLERYCSAMHQVGEQAKRLGLAKLNDGLLKTFLAADMAFHMTVIQASGNGRIMNLVRATRTLSRSFQVTRRQHHDLAIVYRACEFHDTIVRAFRDRDAELARKTMAEHINLSKQQRLAEYDQESEIRDRGDDLSLSLPPELQAEFRRIEQAS